MFFIPMTFPLRPDCPSSLALSRALHWSCRFYSHWGLERECVCKKWTRLGKIPYASTPRTDWFLFLCVFSSHASATRRRKPPTWRLMSGGSTDCVTWWPPRSAWWVTNADTPCDRLSQHQMWEANKWYPQHAYCDTGREYVVQNIQKMVSETVCSLI